MSDTDKDRSSMKDFESFRIYLKKIYEYCSLSAKDFKSLDVDIGQTKYNDYKNKVKSLSQEKFSEHKVGKQRNILKYNVNQFESCYNFLAKAYCFRTLTANEVNMILFVISGIFIDGEKSLDEIVNLFTKSDIKSIIKIVEKCVDSGILEKNANGNYIIKGIDKNILSPDNQLKFLNFVDFMKDIIYPNVFGYYLFEDLKYLYEKQGFEYKSPFQKKNQYSANILDEEVLWKILTAKLEKKYVSFTYKEKSNDKIYLKVNIIKVIVEKQKHRIYIFAYLPNIDKQKIFRLDKIFKVKILEENTIENDKVLNDIYDKSLEHSFLGIPVSTSDKVTFSFRYDLKLANNIKGAFQDVKFNGNIAKVTVSNISTVVPWFKSHIGLVKVIDNQELSDILDEEVKEMKKLYGIV